VKLRRTELKRARIEIIPMIDTIFFLLVFFMITSLSMVQMSAKRVNLPQSTTASEKPMEKVVVTLTREGEYYVDRQQVPELQILPILADKIQQNPAISVVINCDRDQHVAQFERIFDLVKQANAANVMIATAPKPPSQVEP